MTNCAQDRLEQQRHDYTARKVARDGYTYSQASFLGEPLVDEVDRRHYERVAGYGIEDTLSDKELRHSVRE